MKIVIVAMSDSIHVARWMAQIVDQGWELHLFSSWETGKVHPDLRNVTVYHSIYTPSLSTHPSVRQRGLTIPSAPLADFCRRVLERYMPDLRSRQLARLIRQVNPDIVHSLEIQHAGYLVLEAKKKMMKGRFPPWTVTNWGSDIYLFGRLAAHREKIKDVLASADYYSCECERDVCLAQAYGYSGKVLPVFPNTGGFDFSVTASLRQGASISKRRVIMVKGYQTWAGRALVALRALERCSDILSGYTIAIYSATPDVEVAAELLQDATGVPVVIIPRGTPHNEILAWHGRARISLGLSISDAISTSLLEAMVMGAFPVQSWTACADEWIDDGCNGLLVPPEDTEIIEKALRAALTDDGLVNRAAEHNEKLVRERLDQRLLKAKTIELYKTVAEGSCINKIIK